VAPARGVVAETRYGPPQWASAEQANSIPLPIHIEEFPPPVWTGLAAHDRRFLVPLAPPVHFTMIPLPETLPQEFGEDGAALAPSA